MKVRSDFVTNSSSSSYIISTSNEPPTQYSNSIQSVTKENILDVIKQISDYEWTVISYEVENDKFQELGGFTDEQMVIIKLAIAGKLSIYMDLMKILDSAKEPVYHVFVDRDWLYYQDALQEFISDANLLNEENNL